MNSQNPSWRDLRALCAEIHPDDGMNPADFFRQTKNRRPTDRKTRQLCSQVADTLNQVLSGECGDDVLRGLQVLAVVPASNASQLLVVVTPLLADDPVSPTEVLDRLARASGILRSAVAAASSRRRTPKLLFQFVASAEQLTRSQRTE